MGGGGAVPNIRSILFLACLPPPPRQEKPRLFPRLLRNQSPGCDLVCQSNTAVLEQRPGFRVSCWPAWFWRRAVLPEEHPQRSWALIAGFEERRAGPVAPIVRIAAGTVWFWRQRQQPWLLIVVTSWLPSFLILTLVAS